MVLLIIIETAMVSSFLSNLKNVIRCATEIEIKIGVVMGSLIKSDSIEVSNFFTLTICLIYYKWYCTFSEWTAQRGAKLTEFSVRHYLTE